jgi:hypothetical protein
VLLIPGCGGSILYGKDSTTGKSQQIYPKLLKGNDLIKRFMWCDLDDNFAVVNRDKTASVYAPMDKFGLYACSNLITSFSPLKKFASLFF